MALVTEQEIPLRLVGKRVKRADSPERLTGAVRYTGDLFLPGLLHARLVRSPHAAARIVNINVTPALELPGVACVLTARDLPVRNLREAIDNRTILVADERVTYVGQPVAVVLGESEADAEDGAAAVEVDYEGLPAAVDMLEALDPEAPVVRSNTKVSDEELAHGGPVGRLSGAVAAVPRSRRRACGRARELKSCAAVR